jgi:hypothetical protein
MLTIRFYHTKTLLFTYLPWSGLMLCLAFILRGIFHSSMIQVPISWAVLNIAPLWVLAGSYKDGELGLFIKAAVTFLFAAAAMLSGVLINKGWRHFLIIIGMCVWFFWALFLTAITA